MMSCPPVRRPKSIRPTLKGSYIRSPLYFIFDHLPVLRKLGSAAEPKKEQVKNFLVNPSHRPLSSSFLGLPYRILNINPKP